MRNKVKYNTQNSYLSMCDRHNYLNFKILTFVQSVYSFDLEYGPFRAFFLQLLDCYGYFLKEWSHTAYSKTHLLDQNLKLLGEG